MNKRKTSFRTRLFSVFFAIFFAISSLFLVTPVENTYAVPAETTSEEASEAESTSEETTSANEPEDVKDTCNDQAGSVAWLVCPVTKVIANAIDSVYALLNDLLVVEPLSTDQNSPIRLVWDYIRNITNIVFIILLLIVVYSHLTGLGISNFGIKRILPRLVIAAILVNLSWIICTLFVDLSNLLGIGLRGVFTDVKTAALSAGTITSEIEINWASLLGAIISGGAIAGISVAAAGGLGALFWMIIPALLSALVAVVAGLVTLAFRQVLVALLIMISPLAFIAYLIPNTEKWFEKWKKALISMLIFFPTFSFLFGASDLVGWTIITSATNGFGLILGLAVQVLPLFLAFSLMKMSGTIIGGVNNAVRKLSNPLQRTASGYANTEREYRRQKYLASRPKNYQLNKRLVQKMSDQKYRRASDIERYAQTSKLRGLEYASKYRNRAGKVTRRGEELYDMQARNMDYQRKINRVANDFDAGLGVYAVSSAQKRRLDALDQANIRASDRLKYEQERKTKIDYDNATGYFERTRRATMSHIDPNAIVEGEKITRADHARYKDMLKTMEGNHSDTLYIDSGASYGFSAQNRIVSSKFSELFNTAAPTQQLVDILQSLTTSRDANKYIDAITSGLRSLNMRGDTDIDSARVEEITRKITQDLDASGGIKLGTHASQTLASFCMFDVKDNDPFLRRYGKYINLETAHAFNKIPGVEPRHNLNVTVDEYVRGEYIDTDADGNILYNPDGSVKMAKSNKDMVTLLKGTSFAHVERTAYENMIGSIRRAYTDADGNVDMTAFVNKLNEVNNAILPNVIGDALGYASGSEQILSFASYLTGMNSKGNGVWKKLWEDQTKPYAGIPIDYFTDFAELYIRSQVPNQIANFKSDVFENVRQLFRIKAARAYEEASGVSRDQKVAEFLAAAGVTDPASASKDALKSANAKADEFYDNLDSDRDGAMGAIQNFRESLGSNVFARLQNSARSGALNSAKGPVIQWLGIKFGNTKKRPDEPAPVSLPTTPIPTPLVENITGHLMSLTGSSANDYFNQALNLLSSEGLGELARNFSEFYNAHSGTATTAELHNYLISQLDNLH